MTIYHARDWIEKRFPEMVVCVTEHHREGLKVLAAGSWPDNFFLSENGEMGSMSDVINKNLTLEERIALLQELKKEVPNEG